MHICAATPLFCCFCFTFQVVDLHWFPPLALQMEARQLNMQPEEGDKDLWHPHPFAAIFVSAMIFIFLSFENYFTNLIRGQFSARSYRNVACLTPDLLLYFHRTPYCPFSLLFPQKPSENCNKTQLRVGREWNAQRQTNLSLLSICWPRWSVFLPACTL